MKGFLLSEFVLEIPFVSYLISLLFPDLASGVVLFFCVLFFVFCFFHIHPSNFVESEVGGTAEYFGVKMPEGVAGIGLAMELGR